MFKSLTTTAIIAIAATSASADQYQIYFPDGSLYAPDGSIADDDAYVLIVNTSSAKAIQAPLSGYLNRSYEGFSDEWEASIDAAGSSQIIQDLTGSKMTIKDIGIIQVNGLAPGAPGYTYDRLIEFDVTTGEVTSERIIATSEAAYDLMVEAGYETILIDNAEAGSRSAIQFTTYSENLTNNDTGAVIVTEGGFSTNRITAADGASLFRQEEDGTVHIGENSIVLADELVSASGNDEVYSSSGVLQLGNNDDHRTVIRGTLEVSNPTQANHAANKSYVDTGDAATLQSAKTYAEAYSNGIAAMMMASSQITYNTSATGGPSIGIGLGAMDGKNAVAFGFGGLNQNTGASYSASVTYSDFTKKAAFGAGVSWSLN